jgi:large subunit ribosomal protein L32
VATPKKKTSVSRKGKRRAGHTHKLHAKHPMKCPNCGALALPHNVCSSCGQYKGREVFSVKIKEAAENTTSEEA